jgi:hypothetical protein
MQPRGESASISMVTFMSFSFLKSSQARFGCFEGPQSN